jgi:hypothetical protein
LMNKTIIYTAKATTMIVSRGRGGEFLFESADSGSNDRLPFCAPAGCACKRGVLYTHSLDLTNPAFSVSAKPWYNAHGVALLVGSRVSRERVDIERVEDSIASPARNSGRIGR